MPFDEKAVEKKINELETENESYANETQNQRTTRKIS